MEQRVHVSPLRGRQVNDDSIAKRPPPIHPGDLRGGLGVKADIHQQRGHSPSDVRLSARANGKSSRASPAGSLTSSPSAAKHYYGAVDGLFEMFNVTDLDRDEASVNKQTKPHKWTLKMVANLVLQTVKAYPVDPNRPRVKWKFTPPPESEWASRRTRAPLQGPYDMPKVAFKGKSAPPSSENIRNTATTTSVSSAFDRSRRVHEDQPPERQGNHFQTIDSTQIISRRNSGAEIPSPMLSPTEHDREIQADAVRQVIGSQRLADGVRSVHHAIGAFGLVHRARMRLIRLRGVTQAISTSQYLSGLVQAHKEEHEHGNVMATRHGPGLSNDDCQASNRTAHARKNWAKVMPGFRDRVGDLRAALKQEPCHRAVDLFFQTRLRTGMFPASDSENFSGRSASSEKQMHSMLSILGGMTLQEQQLAQQFWRDPDFIRQFGLSRNSSVRDWQKISLFQNLPSKDDSTDDAVSSTYTSLMRDGMESQKPTECRHDESLKLQCITGVAAWSSMQQHSPQSPLCCSGGVALWRDSTQNSILHHIGKQDKRIESPGECVDLGQPAKFDPHLQHSASLQVPTAQPAASHQTMASIESGETQGRMTGLGSADEEPPHIVEKMPSQAPAAPAAAASRQTMASIESGETQGRMTGLGSADEDPPHIVEKVPSQAPAAAASPSHPRELTAEASIGLNVVSGAEHARPALTYEAISSSILSRANADQAARVIRLSWITTQFDQSHDSQAASMPLVATLSVKLFFEADCLVRLNVGGIKLCCNVSRFQVPLDGEDAGYMQVVLKARPGFEEEWNPRTVPSLSPADCKVLNPTIIILKRCVSNTAASTKVLQPRRTSLLSLSSSVSAPVDTIAVETKSANQKSNVTHSSSEMHVNLPVAPWSESSSSDCSTQVSPVVESGSFFSQNHTSSLSIKVNLPQLPKHHESDMAGEQHALEHFSSLAGHSSPLALQRQVHNEEIASVGSSSPSVTDPQNPSHVSLETNSIPSSEDNSSYSEDYSMLQDLSALPTTSHETFDNHSSKFAPSKKCKKETGVRLAYKREVLQPLSIPITEVQYDPSSDEITISRQRGKVNDVIWSGRLDDIQPRPSENGEIVYLLTDAENLEEYLKTNYCASGTFPEQSTPALIKNAHNIHAFECFFRLEDWRPVSHDALRGRMYSNKGTGTLRSLFIQTGKRTPGSVISRDGIRGKSVLPLASNCFAQAASSKATSFHNISIKERELAGNGFANCIPFQAESYTAQKQRDSQVAKCSHKSLHLKSQHNPKPVRLKNQNVGNKFPSLNTLFKRSSLKDNPGDLIFMPSGIRGLSRKGDRPSQPNYITYDDITNNSEIYIRGANGVIADDDAQNESKQGNGNCISKDNISVSEASSNADDKGEGSCSSKSSALGNFEIPRRKGIPSTTSNQQREDTKQEADFDKIFLTDISATSPCKPSSAKRYQALQPAGDKDDLTGIHEQVNGFQKWFLLPDDLSDRYKISADDKNMLNRIHAAPMQLRYNGKFIHPNALQEIKKASLKVCVGQISVNDWELLISKRSKGTAFDKHGIDPSANDFSRRPQRKDETTKTDEEEEVDSLTPNWVPTARVSKSLPVPAGTSLTNSDKNGFRRHISDNQERRQRITTTGNELVNAIFGEQQMASSKGVMQVKNSRNSGTREANISLLTAQPSARSNFNVQFQMYSKPKQQSPLSRRIVSGSNFARNKLSGSALNRDPVNQNSAADPAQFPPSPSEWNHLTIDLKRVTEKQELSRHPATARPSNGTRRMLPSLNTARHAPWTARNVNRIAGNRSHRMQKFI